MLSNPLLQVVNDGIEHAMQEGREDGYIEGYAAGATAMRYYIMQGDPSVPGGDHPNPHDIVSEMRNNLAKGRGY